MNKVLNSILKTFLSLIPGFASLGCIFFFFFLIFINYFDPNYSAFFREGDPYWLIKTGYWILEHHKIPYNNVLGAPFSDLTAIPLVAYQWGFEVFMAVLHKAAGVQGIVWGCSSLLAGTLALMLLNLHKRGFREFPEIFLVFFPTALILYIFVSSRPFIMTLFLGSVMAFLLLYQEKKVVHWILMPVLFIVWANFHLGFIFGLLWLFIEMVFAAVKDKSFKPILVWLLCFVCTGINPNGFSLFSYITALNSSVFMNNYITELHSINFHKVPFLLYLFILAIFSLLYSSKSDKIREPERIMWIITFGMALFSMRHLGFTVFFTPVILAGGISRLVSINSGIEKKFSFTGFNVDKVPYWTAIAIILGLALALNKGFSASHNPAFLSQGFIKYINSNLPDQPVLTDADVGSELIYFTNARSFIDTRFDMYGDNYIQTIVNLYSLREENLLVQKNIRYILCLAKDEPYYFTRLKNGWKVIYRDNKLTLFYRF